MKRLAICLVLLGASLPASAQSISFQLCNTHGVRDMPVVARDKKNGMSVVFSGVVPKDRCVGVSASKGTGDHAEIELRVDTGSPYGVPWIRPGDQVKF